MHAGGVRLQYETHAPRLCQAELQERAVPGSDAHDYPGPAASQTYDARFARSHSVPHLSSHVPQGLATWPKWNGQDDLLVISSYSPRKKDAYIIGLDAK